MFLCRYVVILHIVLNCVIFGEKKVWKWKDTRKQMQMLKKIQNKKKMRPRNHTSQKITPSNSKIIFWFRPKFKRNPFIKRKTNLLTFYNWLLQIWSLLKSLSSQTIWWIPCFTTFKRKFWDQKTDTTSELFSIKQRIAKDLARSVWLSNTKRFLLSFQALNLWGLEFQGITCWFTHTLISTRMKSKKLSLHCLDKEPSGKAWSSN